MKNEITNIVSLDIGEVMSNVLLKGDLKLLKPEEKVFYYNNLCKSLGLNPLTRPFDYIEMNKQEILYAKKDCAEQLRKMHDISLKITDTKTIQGVYIVTAQASLPTGRVDESTGAVALNKEGGAWEQNSSGKGFFKKNGNIVSLNCDDLANAFMKAETKAKRRVTLSICGLGILDETEIETIKNVTPVTPQTIREPKPTDVFQHSTKFQFVELDGQETVEMSATETFGYIHDKILSIHTTLDKEEYSEWADKNKTTRLQYKRENLRDVEQLASLYEMTISSLKEANDE